MSHRRTRTVLRSMVLVGTAPTLIAAVVIIGTRGWTGFINHNAPLAVIWVGSLGLITWLASKKSTNMLVGVLAIGVLGNGFYLVGEAIRLLLDPGGPLNIAVDNVVPADMPPRAAIAVSITQAMASFGSSLFNVFAILLFPNGQLPSRRWRPIAAIFVADALWTFVVNLVVWHPTNTVAPVDHPMWGFADWFSLVGFPLAVLSLIIRYRTASPTERAQIKLVLWGAAVFLPAVVVGSVAGSPPVLVAGGVVLVAAYGIAIVRHNLFDVDVVISRTLAYGMLAALIGLLYIGMVVGIGSMVDAGEDPNPVLAIAATVVVAVAFQPARRRLERLANRLIHGRRATPYEVLSDFSKRVATTSDDLLDEAARSLVEGTGATRVVVSIPVGGERVVAAAWPPQTGKDGTDGTDDHLDIDPVCFPISDSHSTLGSLEVQVARGGALTDEDRRLMEQVAAGMGLALSNQVLTERLAARVDELTRSRRRLIAVQDHTRRQIERDLHDGAQQQLVALKVKLGLCRSLVEQSADAEMSKLIDRLSADADRAVECLRDFARGVYPPLLESEGLEAAIGAQVRRSGIPVEVETDGLGRYPREIESIVYFCVLEALADVADRARANHARVHLMQRNGSLTFEVHDDDVVVASRPGLRRIGDRLEALSGTFHYSSTPSDGTTVIGSLPATATAVMS